MMSLLMVSALSDKGITLSIDVGDVSVDLLLLLVEVVDRRLPVVLVEQVLR